jgi:glucose/arabinose dehydrogenase
MRIRSISQTKAIPRTPRRRRSRRPAVEALEPRLALTTLPAGFTETLLTTSSNLSSPTAMEISPTNQVWVLEQSGNVKLLRSDGTTHTAIDLVVDSAGERGLLGIAFAPDYDGGGPNTDYVYLYYTTPRANAADPANNRVSRFTVSGAGGTTPTLGSELLVRELPPENEDNNLSTDGDTNHNGGAIHFGLDGKLYVAVGDHNYDTSPQSAHVSQILTSPFGKLLRLNADGTNPADNPFYNGSSTNTEGAIWALGLRNPYTFAIQPGTGRIFINDVGEGAWEEIDDGFAAANYGWAGSTGPLWEGFEASPPPWTNYRDPVMAYDHSNSAPTPAAVDITGGVFYPAGGQFGSLYEGKYFFADAGANFIRIFDPSTPGSPGTPDTSTPFASDMTTFGPVDLKVDAAGNLYYLARGGEVYRISGPPMTAYIGGRHIFYNNSFDDGNTPAITPGDFSALDSSKHPYLPGTGAAAFDNLTSYSRGINGIAIDINHTNGTPNGPLSLADFTFKVGNNNTPGTWLSAPAPSGFSVFPDAGESGADRVTIVWADGVMKNTWLQVVVRGNDAVGGNNTNTGLLHSDVFYFGNAVAESGNGNTATQAVVNVTDELAARNHPHGQFDELGQDVVFDYNRDRRVNTTDALLARNNFTTIGTALNFINVSNPPAAPQAAPEAAATVDSPIASRSGPPTPGMPENSTPRWLGERLTQTSSAASISDQALTLLLDDAGRLGRGARRFPRADALLAALLGNEA